MPRKEYPNVPFMALAATLNEKVLKDAIKVLGMRDQFIFRNSFNRPNLTYVEFDDSIDFSSIELPHARSSSAKSSNYFGK